MWGTCLSKPNSGSATWMAPAKLETGLQQQRRGTPADKSGLMSPLLSARALLSQGLTVLSDIMSLGRREDDYKQRLISDHQCHYFVKVNSRLDQ